MKRRIAYIGLLFLFVLGGGIFIESTVPILHKIESKYYKEIVSSSICEELFTVDESWKQEWKDILKASDNLSLQLGDTYGNLVCISLGLDTSVTYGMEEQVLVDGIGQYVNEKRIGINNGVILYSNNLNLIKQLNVAVIGDKFQFVTKDSTYYYIVSSIQIGELTEAEQQNFTHSDNPMLLSLPCPYDMEQGNLRYNIYFTREDN